MRNVIMKLPEAVRAALSGVEGMERCEEIYLRANGPIEVRIGGKSVLLPDVTDRATLAEAVGALTLHSYYMREEDIRRGYIPLDGGCRAGITGRFASAEGKPVQLTHIGGLCIRLAREVIGAADAIAEWVFPDGRPESALIVSPPGMGKTTMLRDLARIASTNGFRVAVSDERGEIAAAQDGVPTMDLGPRAVVADGIDKRFAVMQLLRAMSPDVIVTDEIGHAEDADALLDAARSGVAVFATAHGREIMDVSQRAALRPLMENGLFRLIILLGGRPGQVRTVHAWDARTNAYAEVGSWNHGASESPRPPY